MQSAYHCLTTHGSELRRLDGSPIWRVLLEPKVRSRAVEPPELGPVRRVPMVGGLHSRYYREAA